MILIFQQLEDTLPLSLPQHLFLAAYFNEIWRILTFSEIVIPTSNQSMNSLGDGAGGVIRHNQTYADHDESLISLRHQRENHLSCYILEEELVFLHILHG